MKLKLILLFLMLSNLSVHAQIKRNLWVSYKLRANIFASSSIYDSTSIGGYGTTNNKPYKITDTLALSDSGLFLKIDTTQKGFINKKYHAYQLYLANKTDTIVKLRASDSRLNVIAEVFYDGKWQAIEYMPKSWCGNSYHYVYLKQNEYWAFKVPKFGGLKKAKLRYKLLLGKETYIYSNEINTRFNKGQLNRKQGHKSQGLIDSYID